MTKKQYLSLMYDNQLAQQYNSNYQSLNSYSYPIYNNPNMNMNQLQKNTYDKALLQHQLNAQSQVQRPYINPIILSTHKEPTKMSGLHSFLSWLGL